MPLNIQEFIRVVAELIDLAGVTAIALGVVAVFVRAVDRKLRREPVYTQFRLELGRAILVGLELLVAADIIHTVAIEPTLESVLALGGIVLVRTFLSFSLEVEVTGRWPWQQRGRADPPVVNEPGTT